MQRKLPKWLSLCCMGFGGLVLTSHTLCTTPSMMRMVMVMIVMIPSRPPLIIIIFGLVSTSHTFCTTLSMMRMMMLVVVVEVRDGRGSYFFSVRGGAGQGGARPKIYGAERTPLRKVL